jgi:hypothetical protein
MYQQLRLQRLLDEANGRYYGDKIRRYYASVRRQKDIEENVERRRFLRTGVIPVSDPGVFSILQK